MILLELHGLEVFGYHGAYEDEQRDGQLFLWDVQLDVGERGADDDLQQALDYTHVAARIRELSDAHRFNLLEALAVAEVGPEADVRDRHGRWTITAECSTPSPAGCLRTRTFSRFGANCSYSASATDVASASSRLNRWASLSSRILAATCV